jgi:hypothetical protein
MTRANLLSTIGATIVTGGMYLVHPSLAFLWAGGLMIGVGVLLYFKEGKRGESK